MNVVEAIYARRAVRSYTLRPVDEHTIRSLLKAAVQAPNAMNTQPWLFAVVQDRAVLQRWSDRAKRMLLSQIGADPEAARYAPMLEEPSFDIFYDAGTLVVIGAAERRAYTDADCWLAAENLMLAACDAGLGSCCIGFAVPLLNTVEAKQELGFPPTSVAIAPLVLGYPAVAQAPVPRREPQIASWIRAQPRAAS